MAKESQKLDELNTESTEEKTIQKDGDEQINDISTKDDEKIETVVNESSELSNKNIETETVDESLLYPFNGMENFSHIRAQLKYYF